MRGHPDLEGDSDCDGVWLQSPKNERQGGESNRWGWLAQIPALRLVVKGEDGNGEYFRGDGVFGMMGAQCPA